MIQCFLEMGHSTISVNMLGHIFPWENTGCRGTLSNKHFSCEDGKSNLAGLDLTWGFSSRLLARTS